MNDVFKLLREADAGKQAPDYVETRLRAAFREKHARPARWRWLAAFAAAAVVLVAVWRLSAPGSVEAPKPAPPVVARAVEPSPAPVADAAPKLAVAPRPKPRRARPAPQQPQTLEFVALPYAPPFLPEDQGQVIRVRLPRQSIRNFGLPVNEERLFDRVPADLLIGQDGMARGIRLVSASDMR